VRLGEMSEAFTLAAKFKKGPKNLIIQMNNILVYLKNKN
jgi:hypothetical protein